MKRYKLTRHYTELGSYLQKCREAAGLTQREISLELEYSSAQFISNFERGISAPPLKKLRVLVKKYRMEQGKAVRLLLAGEHTKILEALNS